MIVNRCESLVTLRTGMGMFSLSLLVGHVVHFVTCQLIVNHGKCCLPSVMSRQYLFPKSSPVATRDVPWFVELGN